MTPSSKTIAITVTHNPDFAILKKQLESLKFQCRVILVDNGSREDLLFPLKQYLCDNKKGKLVALNNNVGISAAQNIGIKDAMQSYPGVQYVLLLDHDSIPSQGMIQILETEFQTLYEAGYRPAAIGPLLFDPRDKKYLGFHVIKNGLWKKTIPMHNSNPIECHSLNSSGSLLSLGALKNIGLFEEDFFIDHCETEWCFRAMKNGYKFYGSAKTEINHLMGDEVCNFWLFGWKRTPYRSPIRHYYIIRNSILLQKRSYIPLTWKFWNVVKLLFTYIYFGFFTHEAREHKKFFKRGLIDGLKGITGEFKK